MKNTYYKTTYSYNAGLLATDHVENTNEGAIEFEENYKNQFPDCEKRFTTMKITVTKIFGIRVKTEGEIIRAWAE
jgi:hypothetical protein